MSSPASSMDSHGEDDKSPVFPEDNLGKRKCSRSSKRSLLVSIIKAENIKKETSGCVKIKEEVYQDGERSSGRHEGECKIKNIKVETGGGAPVKEEICVNDEGSLDKAGYSTIVYGCSNYVQEIVKSWSIYIASQETEIDEPSLSYPTLEIRIPAKHVTSSNHKVATSQFWGTDVYTNDSDIIAVLAHTGYYRPPSSSPVAIQEFRVTVQVLPPEETYRSTTRNNIRSRACVGAGVGCSIRVERCCLVNKDGGIIDMKPQPCHQHFLEPTIVPTLGGSVKRRSNTKAVKGQQEPNSMQSVSIMYNLCNEPWLKYKVGVVADKGLKPHRYTSTRLTNGEVLYCETHTNRYELSHNGFTLPNKSQESEVEKEVNQSPAVQDSDDKGTETKDLVPSFRWARCKKILPEEDMLGIPFPEQQLEVIADDLEWEDLQWSETGVMVRGKMYNLIRVCFFTPGSCVND